jgi:ABC-type multidrug transport system fused ATPase/permease subunit
MTESFSWDRQRRLLSDLCRVVADRAAAEEQGRSGLQSHSEAAEQEFQETLRGLEERYGTEKAALEAEYAASRARTEEKYRAEREAIEKEFEAVRAEIAARFAADQAAIEQARQDAHWEAIEAADAARGGLNLPLKVLLAGLNERWKQLEEIHRQAVAILERRGHWRSVPEAPPTPVMLEKHPGQRFRHALDEAQPQIKALAGQRLPWWFQGFRPLLSFFAIWLLAAVPWFAGFAAVRGRAGWTDWRWAAASLASAAVVWGAAAIWLYRIAKRRSLDAYLGLRKTLLEAGLGCPTINVLETAEADCRRLYDTIIARHKAQNQKADAAHAEGLARTEARRRRDTEQAEMKYPKRLADLNAWRDGTLQDIEENCPPRLARLERDFATQSKQLRARFGKDAEENRERFERHWREMAERWQSGIERFREAAEEAERAAAAFPDWNTDDWSRWAPPTAIPAAIPFAFGKVNLADIPGGVPAEERLRHPRTEFTLPLSLPFPRRSLLLLKAAGLGRALAVDLMQSAMLRLLTAMPPGKVRFTIVDPVGLGDNFSAFMHLADFDEQLVASRIWTDMGHIEQRLADLTKHMENVIQVYLRKEFQSIEEYNEFAGEMAEPYRVLVVANFPANFSEAAVHRIKSIVASGARCGVFVLMSVDTNMPMPRNFQLSDLEAEGVVLRSSEGGFAVEHADYGPVPVDFPLPPPVDRFKEIVRAVGGRAKDAGRVEVPFSCIIPPEGEWWTGDSRAGIDVPLGRAGAMKLQSLSLGHGTSQHVLISGKTGSGKSTLLHVLITNLALRYSPDELELYLVDFKKGVEFKAYARAQLPHARVVAIESEREFGMSVLQRLDAELRTRGDLLRRFGLQDIKGYRTAQPEARMPRILLMIDEFQEMFVEDDRIAQDAALLLDRLVRQGRAFGIHVLLGSQTLGGAYTLARSTIGQMAVRIALQCSESDAHLILSEDNTAARLLTRPGEAIYNDANGLYEGNHPFQIVWLPDVERDAYLARLSQLSRGRHCAAAPPIVFEGNVLADLGDNPNLTKRLAAPSWTDDGPTSLAWLGAAVAIKDPTTASFLRQNGANLLLVGHREEAALGTLGACFLSFIAQHKAPRGAAAPEAAARFYVLDGTRADAPEAGFWEQLTSVAPHEVRIAGPRDAAAIVGQIAAEVAARQQHGREDTPPLYLFLYNLGRFRELRRADDFGYGSDDGPPSPAKQLATILREGPPLGVHTLVWCDTYSNVTRLLDRQSMQDFEMRVLFQMNANDSSSLIDSPEAARLGVHRAIYYDEGQGLLEKFRPYGLPTKEFLAWTKKRLGER